MDEYTRKGAIYTHISGTYRIRERKGRAYEVEYAERPSLWISTRTKDFNEADAFVKKNMHSQRRYLPNEKVTFAEFSTDFFTRTGEGSYRERCERFGKNHLDGYYVEKAGLLKNYLLPKFGDWDITRIRSTDIEDWYVSVTSYRHPGEELCGEHKRAMLFAMNDIMQEAVRKGLIDYNPCENVQKIVIHRISNKEVFTSEEIALLFPNDREELMRVWDGSLMWALYFSILVDTGFRYSEAAGLSIDNIDENGGIYTQESIKGGSITPRHRIKTTGKGKDSKYGLLSSYTMNLLEDYEKQLTDKYLFRINGKFIYSLIANRKLRKACEKAGFDIRERTEHCFRHTFDTNMLNNLGPLLEESDVRDLMAHTGYRPEYDHRTPAQILFRLQKVKPFIEKIREA